MTFVYRGAESLGLEYLSAVLRAAGHETKLAFDPGLFDDKRYLKSRRLGDLLSYRRHLLGDIARSKPDLVAISVVTDFSRWALDVAEWVKSHLGVTVVFGGIHPTSLPEAVLGNACVDYVVVGEGEYPLRDLAAALENGRDPAGIPNLGYRSDGRVVLNEVRPLLDPLDQLPFPDKNLFAGCTPIAGDYRIVTSRGCLYRCTYCYNNLMYRLYRDKGKVFRKRSPANTLQELGWAADRYRIRAVNFLDDLFTGDMDWLKDFLPAYRREIGRPFKCTTHPSLMPRDVVRLLKECGCYRIMIGVQSLWAPSRKQMLGRGEENEQILAAVDHCETEGLDYSIDHILGIPGEGTESLMAAATFYSERSRRMKRIKCFYLSYYPNTDIVDLAHRAGALSEADVNNIGASDADQFFFSDSLTERDPALALAVRDFEVYFKLLPVLSRGMRTFILRSRLFRRLRLIPAAVVILVEFVLMLLTGDHSMFVYFRYYMTGIPRGLVRMMSPSPDLHGTGAPPPER
ncbi:MAG: B12-binding domain-containing radical SAM protein [Deltaproteobacteria bacterium]|nr:B12-binding domain-containing radical SAM protein [Deltaproteobacteria bacterium]